MGFGITCMKGGKKQYYAHGKKQYYAHGQKPNKRSILKLCVYNRISRNLSLLSFILSSLCVQVNVSNGVI